MRTTERVRVGSTEAVSARLVRPSVRGKFLFAGDAKLYLRGATYGTFAIGPDGCELYDRTTVERDFATMRAGGMNAARTYTMPPSWLLDAAARSGLRLMVGLPWEQHVAFLDDPRRAREIARKAAEAVGRCHGHPAILGYAVGNEIPAPVVRWYGRRRVERFIHRLYAAVKDADPSALVSYVNYPTTEYLQLPFLDFDCFNVYLETPETLSAYLARLQNLAEDRPLVLAEVGLDSRRHGEERQARVLDWQLRTIFESGCAGAFVYAWTDEWHRGGYPILDWDFGLTRRDRSPKPALATVRRALAEVPFRSDVRWPRVSVVVCAYNAQATIRQCLEGLRKVEYPDCEVIVVDDGSTDATAAIAGEYAVRLICTPNRGLSNARNTGMEVATGEIVAYIDSDAFPDRHWLKYLASAFVDSNHAGIGGPNLAPPGLGTLADCFDNAPGGPTHVLLSDREAEHIPGCNMAFRRERLVAIGGFDPALRVAGDDVDVCWRIQNHGWTLGFSPAAVVWHHRRTTLRSYWKQQRGYGRAEALLERKWPEKYNAAGHAMWGGHIYAKGIVERLGFRRQRIYSGTWGDAPFQPLETRPPSLTWSLALTPEWYLLIAALFGFAALGALWPPLLVLALPVLAYAAGLRLTQVWLAAARARFEVKPASQFEELRARFVVAGLHAIQPLARLVGRLEYGLSLWRRPLASRRLFCRPRRYALWSAHWKSAAAWMEALRNRLPGQGAVSSRGGPYDGWDVDVRGGPLGSARLLLLLEEHGAGQQLARFRVWPHWQNAMLVPIAASWALAAAAGFGGAWPVCAILTTLGAAIAARALFECAGAADAVDRAIGDLNEVFDR